MGRPKGSKNKINKKIEKICLICGTKFKVYPSRIQINKGKYCCKNCELKRIRKIKHGLTGSRFYRIWGGIIERCLNKNKTCYHNYGERGINVCNRWLKFNNFKNDMYQSYLEHYKLFGKDTSIDRINNNGNYKPNNCRWSTAYEQSLNKRTNRLLTIHNKTLSIMAWTEILNISYTTLLGRINLGWTGEEIINTSVKGKKLI